LSTAVIQSPIRASSQDALDILDRLVVALVPPPRRHRHRYHGVLAPNAPLRAAVTARAWLPMTGPVPERSLTRLSKRPLPRAQRNPARLQPICGRCYSPVSMMGGSKNR
jgi:hypothetical protein